MFASRLEKLMNEKKVTQGQLAKYIGTRRQTVSLYASGKSTPPADMAARIADCFGVSLDYLTGRTDYPNTDAAVIEACKSIELSTEALTALISIAKASAREDAQTALTSTSLLESFLYHYSKCYEYQRDEARYRQAIPLAQHPEQREYLMDMLEDCAAIEQYHEVRMWRFLFSQEYHFSQSDLNQTLEHAEKACQSRAAIQREIAKGGIDDEQAGE